MTGITTTLHLVEPTPEHQQMIMDYRAEFLAHGDSMDGTSGLQNHETFDSWYTALCAMHSEETLPKGLVMSTTYLALDAVGKLVGMIDLRHTLNDHLFQFGGHIGYSVRFSERRQGYATQMLSLALAKAKARGIDRVLVTCDKENIASAKTILHGGGVLENEIPEGDGLTQRYWIDILIS